jgi:hypothetical protein
MIPPATSPRTRIDLARWAADLMQRWGRTREYGFHLIQWEHDDGCPLHPASAAHHDPSAQCHCQRAAPLCFMSAPRTSAEYQSSLMASHCRYS